MAPSNDVLGQLLNMSQRLSTSLGDKYSYSLPAFGGVLIQSSSAENNPGPTGSIKTT